MTYKQRYQEAHKEWFAIRYHAAYRDGHYAPPVMPKIKTANGLTKFICNYLLWTKHHGERTNNMGRPIQKYVPKFNIFTNKVDMLEGGIEWQKGSGLQGSSDIKGHINNPNHKFPIPIYLEVKVNRDRQSDEQKAYEQKVTKTGALYCIVKTPEDFFSFYDYVLSL